MAVEAQTAVEEAAAKAAATLPTANWHFMCDFLAAICEVITFLMHMHAPLLIKRVVSIARAIEVVQICAFQLNDALVRGNAAASLTCIPKCTPTHC